MPKTDCKTNWDSISWGPFDFTSSSSDTAGFDCSKMGSETTNLSGRIKPRPKRMSREQMGASRSVLNSAKIDLGLNGFDRKLKADGELWNVFEGCREKLASTETERNADINRKLKQFESSGNQTSYFSSSLISSTSNSHSKDGDFRFASDRSSSNLEASLKNGTFVFCARKAGCATVKVDESPKVDGFGSDKYDPTSCVKLDQHCVEKNGSQQSGDEFGKDKSANFVFGACGNGSVKCNFGSQSQNPGKLLNNDAIDKEVGNVVPDVMAEFELGSYGDSEKVSPPHVRLSSKSVDSIGKDNINYMFGSYSDSKISIDLEKNPTCNNGRSSDVKDGGIENTVFDTKFQNGCLNGVFTFGGLRGREFFSSDGTTKLVHEMNQLNKEKAEESKRFVEHDFKIGSCRNGESTSDCNTEGAFVEGHIFNLTNEMKRMNVSYGAGNDKTAKFTSNMCANVNNVFVFGRSSINENHLKILSEKIPDKSPLSHDNPQLNKTSSFFSSVEIESCHSREFFHVPTMNKDENDGINITSKLAGLDSSDMDLKFSFSSVDHVASNSNRKHTKRRKGKKANGKLRERTVMQQLSGQNHEDKVDLSQQNHESPRCGSPMDFSPYQNSDCSKAPPAAMDSGVKGEHAGFKKDFVEDNEKSHDDESNTNLSTSLPAQDGLTAIKHQYEKKYKSKVGSNHTVQGDNFDKENSRPGSEGTATHDTCEHWRIRGNEAYQAGKFSKAEELYTMGINSTPRTNNLECSMKPLLLCYSNRAATRMTLGRMREAISDCTLAAASDSNFFKVILRAGTCHLVLGEVEDAIKCYNKCLESVTNVCLDRRVTIEAADRLQRAKRVSNLMHESDKLLKERSHDAVNSALESIAEALSISMYSDKLLEMKGRALCFLRMYHELIKLCEQTLDIAEKNFTSDHLDDRSCKSSYARLWRWYLQAKSHYHLGRLDVALDLMEQVEKLPITTKSGDITQESVSTLASSIRELLHLKKSGNEDFQSGRYTEAVEHYTLAISKSVDSRPFMAICFCNRAAAYQSIGQIIDAIADCSVALALDENYQKALSRRATLHETIRDYKQATYDLLKLISLLESRLQEKTRQSGSQNRSGGSNRKDLRKARRLISKIEAEAKKEIPLNFYLILGIKASDTESEIKKAYRKAALRHHPDKAIQFLIKSDVGDDGTFWKDVGEKIHSDADKLFKIIGEAYTVLLDSCKRSKYDNEEKKRNVSTNSSNKSSDSGRPSTSYSSPFERGNWSGGQAGYDTSSERHNSRRYWHDRWRSNY
ncbi:uncharacterized protein [Primulina huaijiensis]|uniref:uncharacterized protein isoform X2 n=1 Tax=Primulina huaijiensis TaxID=1492673 RepID=UPI003CC76023